MEPLRAVVRRQGMIACTEGAQLVESSVSAPLMLPMVHLAWLLLSLYHSLVPLAPFDLLTLLTKASLSYLFHNWILRQSEQTEHAPPISTLLN